METTSEQGLDDLSDTDEVAQAAVCETQFSATAPRASSVENSTLGPEKAVDRNLSTRWSSAFADGQWIDVDLGSQRTITRVVLRWEAAYARSYQVQVSSDRVTWSTVRTESAGNGGTDEFTALNVAARYVRIANMLRATAWGNSLWELEVYGSVDCNPTTPTIPGRIQGEAFARANEIGDVFNGTASCRSAVDGRVDIESTSDGGAGCNVGWTEPGEWLEYDVDAGAGGTFDIALRLASDGAGRTVSVWTTNGRLLGRVESPSGGWQGFQDRVLSKVTLPAGVQPIRVHFDSGLVNLNYVDFRTSSNDTETVATVMARLSLREKCAQMVQGSLDNISIQRAAEIGLGSVLKGVPTDPTATAWADKMDELQDASRRYGPRVPILYGIDAVHGHGDLKGATIFPHNIGLGASRNAALVRQINQLSAKELRATGMHWTFAPALSVVRDQRWGRTYESYGEHPSIVSLFSTAVTGFQGTTLGSSSVMVTLKHFVADGGAEWGTGVNLPSGGQGIDRGNARMSEAALRAIHLSPYPAAVSAGAGSAMASFSSWNDQKLHSHSYLLNTVLKGQLGLNGFVVSDWNGIFELPGTREDQVRAAVNAGIDMLMVPESPEQTIDALYNQALSGGISQTRINDAVTRILTKKFALGLFDNPWARRADIPSVGSSAHRDVARQAVRESLVLLKNTSSFLPLSATKTVCINGSGANWMRPQVGGWTHGWQEPGFTPVGETIEAGLRSIVGSSRVVTSGCQVGIRVVSETLPSYAEFVGDDTDPDHDNSGACNATEGCVVVVLAGRPVDIQGLMADSRTRAIVMAWHPGTEGRGVAEVLYRVNNYNFSGTLPLTWKIDSVEGPVNYCNSGATDGNGNGVADECEDTGQHYSNLAAPPSSVLFPLGYGLRYP